MGIALGILDLMGDGDIARHCRHKRYIISCHPIQSAVGKMASRHNNTIFCSTIKFTAQIAPSFGLRKSYLD